MITRVLTATGVFAFLVFASFTLWTGSNADATAGINPQINFQGKVVNSNGTNVADGTYSFQFNLYNVATGGTSIWTETDSLTVSSGIFQVNLGAVTSLSGVDFNNNAIYLGINFNPGTGYDGEMTPRVQFTSAPYAFNAGLLGGIASTGYAQLGASSAQAGSLNIGTDVQAGVALQAPLLDTATAAQLKIGTSMATSVLIGQTTTPFTVQGNSSSTFTASSGIYTTTVNFQAPTSTVGNDTLTFPNVGGTICTTVASTCSATYAAGGSGAYLSKTTVDAGSAAVTAGNYLYGFTNSTSTAATGGVLQLINGVNTGNTLYVTASGNPAASTNALAVINNTAGTPSGNLLDLQKANVNQFSVDYNGNVTQLGGTATTDTVNGQTISAAASFTGTVTAVTSVLAPIFDTASAGALAVGNTHATSIGLGNTTSNIATTINGTAVVKPTSGNDSTSVLQVEDANSNQLLNIDSTNNIAKVNGGVGSQLGNNTAGNWSSTTALTAARDKGTPVTANGYIYYIGGNTTATYYGQLNNDGTVSSWGTTTVFPATTVGPLVLAVGNYIYAIGGFTSSYVNTVYYAHINSNGTLGAWQTTTSLGTGESIYNQGIYANGYIYVLGGSTGSSLQPVYYAKVHSDGTIGAWTTSANPLFAANSGGSAVAADGYIYLLGGTGTSSYEKASLNSDGSTSAWAKVTTATSLFTTNSAFVADGNVYVVGGYNGTNCIASIEAASLSNSGTLGTFATINSSLPIGRCFTQAAVANGYAYLIGGTTTDDSTATNTTYYISLPRTEIAGSLDLVGLNGNNLSGSGSGDLGAAAGSLSAGNTNIVGTLQVQDSANFNQSLSVNGSFTANSDATFADLTNSTTALQVQNSSSYNELSVDTTNNKVIVGNVTTTTGQGIAGALELADGSADGFGATLQLTGVIGSNQTYSLPTTGGTFCLSSQNCSAAGTGYILNQNATPQTGNFNITGTGVAATLQASTSALSPLFDVAAAGTLSVGTSLATAITIGKSGVITTFPGTAYINTNSTTALNVERNGTHNNVLTVDTTDGTVGIGQAPGTNSATPLTVNGTVQASNFSLSSSATANNIQKNYIEAATAGGTAGQVVVLQNDSGTSDVVTTSIKEDPRVIGVVFATFGSGPATAQVVITGNTVVTADTGAVSIGDQLVTSNNVAGDVMVDNSATSGILGYATQAKAGGSTGNVGVYVHPLNGVTNPNFTGNVTIQGSSGVTVGSTSNNGVMKFLDGTSDGFTGTVSLAGAIGSSQTYSLPTTGGTFCLSSQNCSTAGTGYILNQSSTPGSTQTGNFDINGTGIANLLQTGTVDSPVGNTTLNIGQTTSGNATAINLNQNTSIASGKNLTITSGTYTQTYGSATASNAQSLAFTNSDAAAGVAVQGINLGLTNTTPGSGTNTLDGLNFPAATIGSSDTTNGINFASATGFTNFINSPTAVLSSAGALTGLTALSSSGTVTFSGLTTNGPTYTTAGGVLNSEANLSVSQGGTGFASTTAYGILTGGVTTGAAFQNAGAGTSGQILVSGGPSALPVWTNAVAVSACTNCLVQVPTSNTAGATGANVIAPTGSGIVGLTVEGTSNATTGNVLNIFNSAATPVLTDYVSASGALNMGAAIQPTSSNSFTLGTSGATFSSAYFGTSVQSPSYTGAGSVSVTSGGATALNIDTGGAAAINIAPANATSLVVGNVTSNPTVAFNGSGTFNTTTGAVGLNGNTTVASGKGLTLTAGNLLLSSGNLTVTSGIYAQTYSSAVAGAAHSVNVTNTNTGAGILMQGINLAPTNATATSGVNTLNAENFAAGVGTQSATEVTNGINFASSTGYTNYIDSPTAVLSSAGALTGLTALSSSGTVTFSGLTTNGPLYTTAGGVLNSEANLSVSQGGTGVTSATAYGLLTGGTTTTGALQSLGDGTSGYVLQSGGTGALPVWVNNIAANVCADCIVKTPAVGQNVIAPTAASVVPLTVYGTSSATTANVLNIYNAGTTQTLQDFVSASGSLNVGQLIQPTSNNAIDLGLSGTAFRTGYYGTSVVSPTYTGSGAVSISSGGATALGLDTGGAAALNIAAGNANAVNIGNATSNPTITLNSGSSNINLNSATVASNATTLGLFNTPTTVNALGAATNIGLGASNTTVTLGNTGGTATLKTTAGALTITSAAAATWSTGAGALTVDAAAGLNLGTLNATGVTVGQATTTSEILGTTQLGSGAGTGSLLNNGSTVNTVDALSNFNYSGSGNSGSIGTAPNTVDIYTYISIAQTTTGQTLTIPTPTASATYGRVVYITNSGNTAFSMLGDTTNPGSTATLIWVNKNGTAAWSFAGADGSGILNQNTSAQTANFWINGSGEASTSLLAPALDVISAGVLDVGNATATTVQVGSNGTNNPIINLDSGTSAINIGTGAQARTVNVGTGAGVIQTINVGGTGANVIGIGNTQAAGSISIGTAMTSSTVKIGGTSGSAATTLQAGSGGINLTAATTAIGTVGSSILKNNGATYNAVCSYAITAATTLSTAGKTPDVCTAFDLTATGAGPWAITVPNPAAGAGSLVYVSNIAASTTTVTLLGNTLNIGSTASLVYNGSAWTFAGADAGNLQSVYNGSAGNAPSILETATNKALTVQSAYSAGIASGNELFGVRAPVSGDTLGASILTVSTYGLGINVGGTGQNPTTNSAYDLQFGGSANRTIGVIAQTTAATAGANLTVAAAAGNTSGVGGNLVLNGGAGGNAAAGGTASLIGGASGGGATAGGAASVQGGPSNATAGSNGGAANLLGGAGTSTGTGGVGGAIAITAGASFGSAANVGGTVAVTGGQGSPTGAGGAVTVQGGAGGTTSGIGGLATVQGGNGTVGNAGGVAITGGSASTTSATSAAGVVTINGGVGSTSGVGTAGGAVNINGGAANGTAANAGGAVTIQGGTAAAVAGAQGGAVSVIAGAGSGTGAGAAGSAVTVQGGAALGTGNNAGGNVVLQAGVGIHSGASGSVIAKSGTNNSTTAFQVQNATGGVVLNVDSTTTEAQGCLEVGLGATACPSTASETYSNPETLVVDSGSSGYSGLNFEDLNSSDIYTGSDTYGDLLGIDAAGNVGLSNAAVSLTSPALAYWDGLNNPTVTGQSYPLAALSGDAAYTGGVVQLTTAANNENGSVNWSFAQVPFEEIQFQMKAGGGTGADGTWFYSYSNAIPTTEYGAGMTNGYIIYFGEYHGCAGITYGGFSDGNQCNSGGGTNPLTSVPLGNVADGNWHNVDIQIRDNVIVVRWDGAVIMDYTDAYTRDLNYQDFGFGARTGGSNDTHDIKGLLVTKLGTNTSQYDIDTTASPLANGLYWDNTSDPGNAAGTDSPATDNSGKLGVNSVTPTANLEVDGTTALEGPAYTTATNMDVCQMTSSSCSTSGTPPTYTTSIDVWSSGSTATTFTSALVGDKITFSNGVSDTIASVVSATELTVSTARIVAPGTFEIYNPNTFQVNSSGNVTVGAGSLTVTSAAATFSGTTFGDSDTTSNISGSTLNVSSSTLNVTSNNTVYQPGTDSATALVVEQSVANGGQSLVTVDSTTTNAADGVLIVGSNNHAGTQLTLLQLNSDSTYADTGTVTCTTSTNQGSMYYNSSTNSIRGCVNGGWEDVVTTSGLGLIAYGVIPDSSNAGAQGDLVGSDGITNSPCKVTWLSATSVTVAACNYYSQGRKQIYAGGTITGLTGTQWYHVCFDSATSTAPVATASTNEYGGFTGALAFSANNPILCLADVQMASSVMTHIYDTRVFTTSVKSFETVSTTNIPLGTIVKQSGTATQAISTAQAGTDIGILGVVVATSGAGSTTTPNAIVVTSGAVYVKTNGTSAVDQYVMPDTTGTVGYSYASATLNGTGAYSNMGISQMSVASSCTTASTAATDCQYSQFVQLDIR